MLTQILLGIVFIVLPLTITFALPLIQEYFSRDNVFNEAIEECEALFVEEARVVQVDVETK